MYQINAAELQRRTDNGETLNLLDVREVIEYHTFNIGGQNIPLAKLVNNLTNPIYNKTDEIIVICSAGIRSETAAGVLTQNGYANVFNLTGGLKALQKLKNKHIFPQ